MNQYEGDVQLSLPRFCNRLSANQERVILSGNVIKLCPGPVLDVDGRSLAWLNLGRAGVVGGKAA